MQEEVQVFWSCLYIQILNQLQIFQQSNLISQLASKWLEMEYTGNVKLAYTEKWKKSHKNIELGNLEVLEIKTDADT